jgi:FkbM family methyltransferase
MSLIYNAADYFLQNHKEKEIYKYISNNKSKIIFDVGSLYGSFTKAIIKLEKKRNKKDNNSYYLFDPNIKAKTYINDIIKRKNIHFYNYGLGNKPMKLAFHLNTYFEAAGSGFQTIIKNDKKWNRSRRIVMHCVNFITQMFNIIKNKPYKRLKSYETTIVNTSTVDIFCKKIKIKKIDLLKIDTEGHEQYVLEGCVNLLKKEKIHFIYLEVLGHKNKFFKKKNKIKSFLKKYNFIFIKEYKIKSVSTFSDSAASDLLFINKNFKK